MIKSIAALLGLSMVAQPTVPVVTEKREPLALKQVQKRVPKGCSVFTFGKVEIVALNRKSAKRKYDNYCKEHGIDNVPKTKAF